MRKFCLWCSLFHVQNETPPRRKSMLQDSDSDLDSESVLDRTPRNESDIHVRKIKYCRHQFTLHSGIYTNLFDENSNNKFRQIACGKSSVHKTFEHKKAAQTCHVLVAGTVRTTNIRLAAAVSEARRAK